MSCLSLAYRTLMAGCIGLLAIVGPAIFAPELALAQEVGGDAPISQDVQFVFNTLLFLIAGMAVMFMVAGFCLLEVGLVRAQNAAMICVKTLNLFAVAGVMVWLTGYHLIYSIEPGGFLGEFKSWGASEDLCSESVSAYSGWFFQMVFVAVAALIVPGAVAERVRLWPLLIFAAYLTGLVYPVAASWHWGQGWLAARGFTDFAGATLVHAVGGWAALAGVLAIGPRTGRFDASRPVPMPGSNLPLATLGTLILWLGWFGFNGGAQLAMGTIEDAGAIAKIFVNTNMAACGGVLTTLLLTQFVYGKVDLTVILNGVIGGLVSITGDPLSPAIWQALLIGSIGGVLVTVAIQVLDRLKIDDVVGAIPAHLVCGLWGTLVVAWPNPTATVVAQITGMGAISVFAFLMSYLGWTVLKYSIGLRVPVEAENMGLDRVELGLEAYPDFKLR